MDTDFANMFVQKQRDTINELMMKVLMLETKTTLMEKALQEQGSIKEQAQAMQAQHASLIAELQSKTEEAEGLAKKNATLEKQLDDLKKVLKPSK